MQLWPHYWLGRCSYACAESCPVLVKGLAEELVLQYQFPLMAFTTSACYDLLPQQYFSLVWLARPPNLCTRWLAIRWDGLAGQTTHIMYSPHFQSWRHPFQLVLLLNLAIDGYSPLGWQRRSFIEMHMYNIPWGTVCLLCSWILIQFSHSLYVQCDNETTYIWHWTICCTYIHKLKLKSQYSIQM